MKFYILLLIITVCSYNSYSQINFAPLPNQPADNIVSVVIDPTTDDLYACNSTSVLRSTDKGITWITTANTGASKITVLYVSPSGKLYLGAVTSNTAPFEGVFTYDKVNNLWSHLAGSPLKVTAIIEDATNNLFVGTGSTDNLDPNPINYGAGVYRYSGSVWTQINSGINNVSGFSVLPFIKAFSFLKSGELIIATYGNGVLKYSAGSWSQYGTGLNSLNVNCLFANTSGTLFAGTDAGVSSTNGSTWTNASNGLTVSKPVRALVGLSNGDIYAGIGLYHYQKGDVAGELFFTTNNGSQWQNAGTGFNSTSVLSMTANSNGKIFASANGVWTYSGSVWTYSFSGNKIPKNKIFGLAKNSKGHLFAICSNLQSNSFGYGGVFRSTDNGSTWISINNGIKCQGLTSIFVDSKDNIWVGGNQFVGGKLITTQWQNPDLYKSIDNGNTWAKNTSIATCHVGYFFIDEDSNGKLYVTHAFFAGQTNVSSTTDYNTFDNTLTGTSVAIVAGRAYGLGISPNNDVFVGVETGYGILRSTSAGAAGSFSPLLNNNNPSPFTGTGPYGNNSVYIDPNTGNLFSGATHGYINGVESAKNIWGALGANTKSLGINGQFMFPFNNLPGYSSLTSMICDSQGNAYLNINSNKDFNDVGLYVGRAPFNSSTPFTKVIFTGSISYYFTNFMIDDCGYLYGNSVSGAGINKSTTLVNVPSVSSLLSPLNSSQSVSPTTTLTWTHPCATASFDLQVATDINFTNIILHQSNINSKSSVMGSGILNNNAQYFWRVRAVNTIGSGKWSSVYTFTTSPAANRHWVGAASTVWSNPANWSSTAGGTGGVPAPLTSDNVFFDGGSSIDCTIDLGIEVSSFTMDPSYSGTVSQGPSSVKVDNSMNLSGGTFAGGNGIIDVNGPFHINGSTFISTTNILTLNDQFDFSGGSFFHNNGTVKFNGTSTQAISGSRVTDFNNIFVTNASANPGVQIQSDQNLHGVLTLANNVVFDADGSGSGFIFKLISSADNPTQDAAIDILPGGAQILGNITVQRYMSIEGIKNGRIYRYISSPLLDATVQDIQNEIPVSGTFTGASVCSTCGAAASMFSYTENITTDMDGSSAANSDDGYFAFPSSSNNEALQNGKGYAMYVRGDLLSSALWDVRGTPSMANISAVDLPVSFTSSNVIEDDGWNLVGNPLPSTIDWNSSGWSKNNIDGSVYVPDNGGAALKYATYNGVTGTNGGSRYIALGQAFWVKANGSGTPQLQANENVKAPHISTTFFRSKPLQNLLRIALVSATAKDETVIHFRGDATDDFDSHADAIKRPNATINLSSKLSNGTNLAINSQPTLNCNSTILLDVENTTPGVYSLDFSELESFPNTVAISLTDNFANTKLDVRKDLSYDFAVSTSSLSYGASRFEINFSVPPPDLDFKPTAALVCEGSDARIIINNSQINATYVMLTENKIVSDSITGNGGAISMIIKNENIQKGKNMFTIQSDMEGCSQVIKKDITFGTFTLPSIISVQEGMACRQGSVTLKASSSSNADLYNWYEGENAVNFIENMHDSIFVTPALSKSKTYYVSSVNEAGCEGLKTPIKANVIYYDAASITETKDTLSSNYSTGNQWFYNNESIPFATSQSIKVQLPGTYTVQVNHEGCVTSADHHYVVTGTEFLSNTIKVYPNPTHNELELELPDYIKNIQTVKVINSVGQQVGVIDMLHENNKTTGKFQMNNLPAGIYIVSIVSTTKSYEVKVIKE